jgi:hypothetical protein
MLHEVLSGSSCSLLFSFGVCRYVQGRVDRCFVNRTLVATCLSLFCFLPWYEYICTPRVLVVLLLRTSDRILRHFQFSYICSHAWTLKNSTINLYGSHFFPTNHHIRLSQPGHTSVLAIRYLWRAGLLLCALLKQASGLRFPRCHIEQLS